MSGKVTGEWRFHDKAGNLKLIKKYSERIAILF
jgi:hypothetical protein